MSTIVEQSDIIPVNSTSYVDLLGVLAGLRRFTGETAEDFRDRIWRAMRSDRSPRYIGLLNELNLQLGLQPWEAIRIWDSSNRLDISVALDGLSLSKPGFSAKIPLVSIDADDLWVWKKHSELVAAVNATGTCYAELLGNDGPVLQLLAQSNVKFVRNEPVSGATAHLRHEGLVVGSEIFTTDVPSYTVTESGRVLVFSAPVPDETYVSYRYRISPYALIASDVGLLNLNDPSLAAVATTGNNKLVYQVREYLQAIAEQDRSYWGA